MGADHNILKSEFQFEAQNGGQGQSAFANHSPAGDTLTLTELGLTQDEHSLSAKGHNLAPAAHSLIPVEPRLRSTERTPTPTERNITSNLSFILADRNRVITECRTTSVSHSHRSEHSRIPDLNLAIAKGNATSDLRSFAELPDSFANRTATTPEAADALRQEQPRPAVRSIAAAVSNVIPARPDFIPEPTGTSVEHNFKHPASLRSIDLTYANRNLSCLFRTQNLIRVVATPSFNNTPRPDAHKAQRPRLAMLLAWTARSKPGPVTNRILETSSSERTFSRSALTNRLDEFAASQEDAAMVPRSAALSLQPDPAFDMSLALSAVLRPHMSEDMADTLRRTQVRTTGQSMWRQEKLSMRRSRCRRDFQSRVISTKDHFNQGSMELSAVALRLRDQTNPTQAAFHNTHASTPQLCRTAANSK